MGVDEMVSFSIGWDSTGSRTAVVVLSFIDFTRLLAEDLAVPFGNAGVDSDVLGSQGT